MRHIAVHLVVLLVVLLVLGLLVVLLWLLLLVLPILGLLVVLLWLLLVLPILGLLLWLLLLLSRGQRCAVLQHVALLLLLPEAARCARGRAGSSVACTPFTVHFSSEAPCPAALAVVVAAVTGLLLLLVLLHDCFLITGLLLLLVLHDGLMAALECPATRDAVMPDCWAVIGSVPCCAAGRESTGSRSSTTAGPSNTQSTRWH